MKRMKRSLWVWCIAFLACCGLSAQETEGDSLRISLLTCSPGTEIYELFGHTAIRVQDFTDEADLVFNYGIFNFDAPHFVWRYIKGETDYELGVTPYDYFILSYSHRNSSVTEQELNLTKEEKDALFTALKENYLPENRVYRYNYFYDNCTSRARIKIEEAVDGLVKYDENIDIESFRSIIHQYTKGHPWDQFGIDLCLGSGADREIDRKEKMFVPANLYNTFRRSLIVPRDGEFRDLVTKETKLNEVKESQPQESTGITPLQSGMLLLLVVGGLSVYGLIRGRSFWGLDVFVFGTAGLAGCILGFLALFSEHPAVGGNWNLCVLQPLHLFALPYIIWSARKREKNYYHMVNLLVITLFIMFMGILPQKINPAVLPLALCLWIRSGCYTLLTTDKWR